MDSGDFGRLLEQGRMVRDRLVVLLGGSINETRLGDEWLRRLMWPIYCGARVYDPMWGHVKGGQNKKWVRLDVRSGNRLVEVLFEEDCDPFRFAVICDGSEVLTTYHGDDSISQDTGDDTIEFLMSILHDLQSFDPNANTWRMKRLERRDVEVRDTLLLRSI